MNCSHCQNEIINIALQASICDFLEDEGEGCLNYYLCEECTKNPEICNTYCVEYNTLCICRDCFKALTLLQKRLHKKQLNKKT